MSGGMVGVPQYNLVIISKWRWWCPWKKPVLGLQPVPNGGYVEAKYFQNEQFKVEELENTLRETSDKLSALMDAMKSDEAKVSRSQADLRQKQNEVVSLEEVINRYAKEFGDLG